MMVKILCELSGKGSSRLLPHLRLHCSVNVSVVVSQVVHRTGRQTHTLSLPLSLLPFFSLSLSLSFLCSSLPILSLSFTLTHCLFLSHFLNLSFSLSLSLSFSSCSLFLFLSGILSSLVFSQGEQTRHNSLSKPENGRAANLSLETKTI